MHRSIKYLLIVFAISICNLQAFAIFYHQYLNTNTLLNGNIYHVVKDSKGFLWFCTPNGISKFDGQNFKNFTVLDGLGDNDIFNLIEDKHGRLWVCTYNGNACYIRNDSVFNTLNSKLLKNLPTISFLNTVYDESDSVFYLGYRHGQIIKVVGSDASLIKTEFDIYGSINQFTVVNNDLIVYCGLANLKIMNNTFTCLTKHSTTQSFCQNEKTILNDDNSIKLYQNNSLIWERTDKSIGINNIVFLYSDNKYNIFLCTNSGLKIINTKTGKTFEILINHKVSCVTEDIDGNYWVTTLGNGVYVINRELDEINLIDNIAEWKTCFTENNQLFKQKEDSVFYLNDLNCKFEKLPIRFNKHFEPKYNSNKFFIFCDPETIATYCLFKQSKKISTLSLFAKSIIPLDENNFLCITHHFLYNIHIEHNNKIRYRPIFDHRILLKAFNNKDKLYFVSEKTLYEYNCNTEILNPIDSFLQNETPISIFIQAQRLILFTSDKLIIYNTQKNNSKNIFDKPEFLTYNLYDLKNNSYILNTNLGYYISQKGFDEHGKSNLLKIEYPFRQATLNYLYPYGDKFICSMDGLLYAFNSSLFYQKTSDPVLFLKQITIDTKAYADTNIQVFNKPKCDVKILLGSLFFNNARNSYQYRINENNEYSKWYTGSTPEINILLRQGNYKIEMRAITDNLVTSPIKSINLIVSPPFYSTLIFYVVIIIILSLSVVYIVNVGINKRRRQFQQELNYIQLEFKAINSLINPHFIFNALNNIQGLINKGSKELANEYISSVGKLIRQNIENLQFDFIPLEKELELINNYVLLQNLRFSDKIKYNSKFNMENIKQIQIPPLLIHSFIENAIVHGFKKEMDDFEIYLELFLTADDYLIINITDNGVGFDKTKVASSPVTNKISLGIEFTKKRLKRLSDFYKVNFSLEIKSVLSDTDRKGTQVEIILYSNFYKLIK